jgi:integrase/recombinase XerD
MFYKLGLINSLRRVRSMDLVYLMKKELFRRGYSPRTLDAYTNSVSNFLKKCKKDPKKVTKKDVRDYLYYLAEKGMARSTLNLNLQALKFALINILGKRFILSLPGSKKATRLPIVLSKKEVSRIFEAIKNKKHRLMIKLLYSAGLRVSELVKLKVEHIDLDNMYGWVRRGKGNKDRMFIIAESIKDDLNEIIEKSYLFKGRRGHISVRTIQQIVKKATLKARIRKKVNCHTFRHSFATHLIEDGYPITTVQVLLGHKSVETTMIYVHIARPSMLDVKSPLD